MSTRGPIMVQALEHRLVKRTTQGPLGSVRVEIDNNRKAGELLPKRLNQVGVLGIHNDRVHLGKLKNVVDVFGLEADVDGHENGARRGDAIHRL